PADTLRSVLADLEESPEIGFVCLWVNLPGGCEPFFIPGRKSRLHFPRDGERYLALHRQHVARIAVVAIRPEMAVRRRVNQLRVDAHRSAVALNGALYHRVDVQLAGDLL